MRIWLVLILLAGGCAPYPAHELANRYASCGCGSLEEEAARRGLEIGEWPEKEWWKGFDDEVLSWLIEKGMEMSPTLQRAEEALRAAAEVAGQKRAALFPEVDFAAQTNWQHLAKYGFFRSLARGFRR